MKSTGSGMVSLTQRETQVLNLIWDGLKNREIGNQLRISHKTVEAHRSNMMKKLRTTNTPQLLKSCFEQGFLRQRAAVRHSYR
ncbi:MAG: LuxR C-terminal-related transcriptional regulator [Nitrospirota bacterium]